MSKQNAEVYYWMSEFISECGQWPRFLEYMRKHAIEGKQICTALNEAAEEGDYSADLEPEDCE